MEKLGNAEMAKKMIEDITRFGKSLQQTEQRCFAEGKCWSK